MFRRINQRLSKRLSSRNCTNFLSISTSSLLLWRIYRKEVFWKSILKQERTLRLCRFSRPNLTSFLWQHFLQTFSMHNRFEHSMSDFGSLSVLVQRVSSESHKISSFFCIWNAHLTAPVSMNFSSNFILSKWK